MTNELFVPNGFISADRANNYWYSMSKIAGANRRLFEDARSWPAFDDASLSGYQPSRVYLNRGLAGWVDYQLFIFFMITDPRTVVRGRRWQVGVAVLVAVVEALIRLASDQAWPLPTAFNAAPAFPALTLVGPVAKWIDLPRSPPAARA